MAWSVRVCFELLTESADMRIDSPGTWKRLITACGIENRVAGERAAGVLQEEGQQVVFGGSKSDYLSVSQNHAPIEINQRAPEAQNAFRRVGERRSTARIRATSSRAPNGFTT
jgi:hypothetical protein